PRPFRYNGPVLSPDSRNRPRRPQEKVCVPNRARSTLMGYLVAVGATAAAVLLRWLLDPWMGNNLPLVTLYGAVAAAVCYGGYRPALVATALGFLACDYLFIEPRGTLALQQPHHYIGVVLYLFT